MAGYNTIRGLRVKYLSADPANSENGQVWYNSTTGNLRVDGIALAASWASGGNYPQSGFGGAGVGTLTAGLGFAGQPTPLNTLTAEYNGSWTAVNAMPSGRRYLGGFGIQTAAVAAQGTQIGAPETNTIVEYDGTNWTAGNNANTAKGFVGAAGILTAGITFGGANPGGEQASSELYNGTDWTNGPTMNAARANLGGAGTQTAALALAGNPSSPPTQTTATESFNGSSWSNEPTMSVARFAIGSAGTQTAGLGFGGYTSPGAPNATTGTELYNGTSWSTSANMASAKAYNTIAAGPGSSAFAVGGAISGNATEEFTGATTQIKNLSTS